MRKLLLSLVLAMVAHTALAAYPERPITMIIAYSPGGGTDLVARALAPYLEKYLGGGAKIVIVNRAGAGGEVGFAALANAPADGYTIGFINTPPLSTIPIERSAQFGGPERFDLLGNIVDDPCNFAVHSDTPVRNLQELAAYARANPGKVTVGTTGIGSDDHLLMLMFERAAPKGLPPEVRERLVKAVASAAADPEFQTHATKFYAPLRFLDPTQFE